MASGTVASGIPSYSSTTASTSTPDTVTFADRYGYVTVANTGTALLYVRTDGSAAGNAAEGSYVVQAGETQLFANAQMIWYQSSKVIPKGANQFGGGNTADNPASPGIVQSQESLAGQLANPGTTVSVISPTSGTGYTIAAAG